MVVGLQADRLAQLGNGVVQTPLMIVRAADVERRETVGGRDTDRLAKLGERLPNWPPSPRAFPMTARSMARRVGSDRLATGGDGRMNTSFASPAAFSLVEHLSKQKKCLVFGRSATNQVPRTRDGPTRLAL